MLAGASSQPASASSPARVRAVHKSLEERTFAEEIEVGRVGMLDVKELEPFHPLAGPPALEPRRPLP